MTDLSRASVINKLRERERYDLIVIGGGATGAGIALDAAARGYAVALLEREDFGSGTSSKSSKLVHGGVRYLANGEFSLVREALRERALLLDNAPHLVEPLNFVIPAKNLYERVKYRLGLWLYDQLAGESQFERSSAVPISELRRSMATLRHEQFSGAVKYADGLFDDTRLLWDLVHHALRFGADAANYCRVVGLIKQGQRIAGVEACDQESGDCFKLHADAVINATGAWSDEIGALDNPNDNPSVVPSQGTHIVVGREFFPANDALLIPRTRDGRVMFVIPWYNKVVIGTTDEKLARGTTDAVPKDQEIELILQTARDYLAHPPERTDISACFAGIRPLSAAGGNAKTAKISREHAIEVAHSGLITISGGKWTTYRLMAEQCVDTFERVTGRDHLACVTSNLKLAQQSAADQYRRYGINSPAIEDLLLASAALREPLSQQLAITAGEVIFATRHEMARTVMDVLARRTRSLFVDAQAAIDLAPRVAELMRAELDQDAQWGEAQMNNFMQQAAGFVVDTKTGN